MAGRPREFDRDAALKKARDLFWERGYEGVSMSDLTKELGLASARIYAAFGSKESLFREAVGLYEAQEGGFAERALSGSGPIAEVIERLFVDAIDLYTRKHGPRGCMVVSSAANCTDENEPVRQWLASHRSKRTVSILARLQKASEAGELPPTIDASALGDLYASALHGISIQARDGVSRKRLLAMLPRLLGLLKAQ